MKDPIDAQENLSSGLIFSMTQLGVLIHNPANLTTKLVEHKEFIKIYGKYADKLAEVKEEVGVITVLPEHCMFVKRSPDTVQALMYIPGGPGVLKFKSKREDRSVERVFNIPYPNLLVNVTYGKNTKGMYNFREVKYFCTDYLNYQYKLTNKVHFPESGAPGKRIFLLPFSNMYNDGRMCFGGNTAGGETDGYDLSVFNHYVRIFKNSFFNEDLGINNLGSGAPTDTGSVISFYEALSREESFPYHWLSGYTNLSSAVRG